MSYILSPSRREYRVKDLTDLILKEIGNMYPLSDKEIKKDDGGFYRMYTPYSKRWFSLLQTKEIKARLEKQSNFDKTHIKNSSYSLTAHGDIEDEQRAIRKGLLEVLDGKRDLPMKIINWPNK